jgi:hypothetical protein
MFFLLWERYRRGEGHCCSRGGRVKLILDRGNPGRRFAIAVALVLLITTG